MAAYIQYTCLNMFFEYMSYKTFFLMKLDETS